MKYIFGTIVAIIIITAEAFLLYDSGDPIGGAYTPTKGTASSSVMTVTTDAQILASSTGRLYARVINNCSSAVYITDNGDIGASLATAFYLGANGGVWDTLTDNAFLYTGAVRASSTNETSCKLQVSEWK